MAERSRGDEAGRDAGSGEEGPTPPGFADARESAPVTRTYADPPRLRASPGRSQGPTPGAELDLARAEARARLRAELFQIESEPLRVGRFTILSRLGQGGMGVVYAAYDEDLDRKVAIKVMRPEAGSTTAQERMRREAQAMARLSHPNIVAVHEVGELAGQVYIAMEFVRGRDLERWLTAQERPWPEVLAVFERAGRGLHAAHEAGLVHRDFKPQNVMVADDGSVKVLDFGLARTERSAAERQPSASVEGGLLAQVLTGTGTLVGTPAYMAPEQLQSGPVTARSDQFSFCVALFRALYGVHPFEGDTLTARIEAVSRGRIREPPGDSAVPARVRAVVRRGLAVDPMDRYPSIEALLEALARDPSRRRRRRVGLGIAVLAIFGGGFAAAQLGVRPDPQCPSAREALHGIWSDEGHARVREALEGTGSPQGREAWARLEPMLDGYVDRWVEGREAACRARDAGESSDLLYERRLACLDRAQAGLDTLVGVLGQADAATLDRAVVAAAELPDLGHCADAEILLAEVEPPPEAIADEVVELRRSLSRAQALEDLGRIEDSRQLAARVQQRAQALSYPPLMAEARLQQGSIQLTAGAAEAAERDLGEAIWIAMEAGHDAVAAEAAARRLWVRGELLRRPPEALAELPWARALAARADDPRLWGLLLNNAAMVHNRQGNADQARALLTEALAIKREVLPPDHPELAFTLANLGIIEWGQGELSEAREVMGRAAALIDAALGPGHPRRAVMATMLGKVLIDQGRFEAAAAELSRADAIYRGSRGTEPTRHIEVHAMQGELALAQRRWAEARRIYEDALARAEPELGAEHPLVIELRRELAVALAGTGHPAEAESLMSRVIEQLEAIPGGSNLLVFAWIRRGQMRLRGGSPAAAREAFERAQARGRAAEGTEPVGDAWRRIWLGRTWLREGDVDRAEPLIHAGAQTLQQLEPAESPRVLDALDALADLAWAQGRAADSMRALDTLESRMAEHRASDDPELAWVRARAARARFDVEPGARGSARALARRTHAILAADPGWAEEATLVREWLDTHAP